MNTATEIDVRIATMDDLDFLVDGNIGIARETEELDLDRETVVNGVRNALLDPSKALYYIARLEDRPAGMLMITREWSDWRNGDIWWIQSVYVHSDFRRRGVFRQLYRFVEDQAKEQGAAGLRLYVIQCNTAAQETYKSLGMDVTEYGVMEVIF